MTHQNNSRNVKDSNLKFTGWRQSTLVKWILMALFVVLFYFNLASHIIPETYNITEGSMSDKEIKAPTEIRDEKATREAEEKASNEIEDSYTTVVLRNETLVESIFLRIEHLNADDQVTKEDKIDIYRSEIPGRYDEHIQTFTKSSSAITTYNELLLEELSNVAKGQRYTIPEETFYKLPQLTQEQLSEMRIVAKEIVRKLTNEPIRNADTARTQVAEMVNSSTISNRTAREIVQEMARFSIMPNKFLDKTMTDEAREAARNNTTPIIYKENEVMVKKNQEITPELYALLTEANMLQGTDHHWSRVGVVLLSLILSAFLYVYLSQTSGVGLKLARYNNTELLMLLLIFLINCGVLQLTSLIQAETANIAGYFAPAALGVMLITLLIDEHLAMASTFVFSIVGSVILNTSTTLLLDFKFGVYIIVISLAAIYSIKHASQRSAILKAGIMVSLFGTFWVLTVILMAEQLERMPVLYSLGLAFGGGLITSILVVGLMPFFEISFGILSALKLVELSSPNHPLLRKLLTETPGTYHHSVMVGNLAEAAAESIGANGLLCRVGSFYHDLGKTKRPSYFIENQTNMSNPHDTIDPMLSKSIIVAHAKDGAEMLKAYNIPKQLRDIAEQHHGTTSLKFFYYKALQEAKEQGVDQDFTEDDFRYPGPKAQSKEAAVVGIADCVEAAVRSLRNPTIVQVEEMIHKIIKNRVDDNQYNECDL
ncbi:MAG TPA: HDIG domain-containing protein, partial [Candidatus Paenibacillus intestinavium]|nr:HDIG domain-containing protein [Candidatus Paenibacillus intestinavium]